MFKYSFELFFFMRIEDCFRIDLTNHGSAVEHWDDVDQSTKDNAKKIKELLN